MNWFMLITATLYVGAAAVEAYRSDWHMAAVYTCWAVANTALGVR